MLKKKIWANFQRFIGLLTQKIVIKLLKIWVWDPGSVIRKKPIPDPGSRDKKSTGSRIRIRNTAKIMHDFIAGRSAMQIRVVDPNSEYTNSDLIYKTKCEKIYN